MTFAVRNGAHLFPLSLKVSKVAVLRLYLFLAGESRLHRNENLEMQMWHYHAPPHFYSLNTNFETL